MKNDARFLLNKKKWINSSGNRSLGIQRSGSRAPIDARKILNSKRANQIVPVKHKQFVRGERKFKQTPQGIFTKAFAAAATTSQVPNKNIKVTTDGNILVTAKSNSNKLLTRPPQKNTLFGANTVSRVSQIQKPVPKWAPAEVDMDLEHMGIDDLIDMESLPPAVVSSNAHSLNRLMLPKSLADGMSGMQNTMVADHIPSTTAHQSVQVFVSNLHSSVSKQDIMELFGDVGIVKSVEMPQVGTAVIEYFDANDATKACSIYHNRLLDGHPMKCYLQSHAAPPRSSVSQRLGGRVENISTIASSSPFVSNPRSRYNPRDVRFTVKLT